MPVRDSTAWRHAIIEKKVINHDRGGTYVICAWDICENPGHENNKVVVHNGGEEQHDMTYVFCTERHKYYWLESSHPGRYGMLPAGRR